MILRHGISRPQSESEVSTSWAGLSVVSTSSRRRQLRLVEVVAGGAVELAEGVSEEKPAKKSDFLVERGAQGVKGTLGRQEARSSNS